MTAAQVRAHQLKHPQPVQREPGSPIAGVQRPGSASEAPKRCIAAQEQGRVVATILQKGGDEPCAPVLIECGQSAKTTRKTQSAASNAAPTSHPAARPVSKDGAEIGQKQANSGNSTLKTGVAPKPIVITLPIPDRRLSPNARTHWAAKAKLTREHRTRAMLLALAALPSTVQPKLTIATVQIDWYHRTAHRLDSTNAIGSCKAYEDGLTDAGIWHDDSGVTHLPVRQFTDKANPRIVLTISA